MSETLRELGWTSYLDDGEKIIWQGRPDQAFHFQVNGFARLGSAVFVTLFSLFWMTMASRGGGVFWMFGLIIFAGGVWQLINVVYGPTFKRRHSWYTLTNRRAFIATEQPIVGRKLQSYPLTPETMLDYHAGELASVYFAEKVKRTQNGSYTIPIGFERIVSGDEVFRLMREVQSKGQAT
ncbi:aspartate carbamoyltransferase catalytic subunit [Aliiroseovarius sp. F20344]|uniref:aspartate carbamoyltransferase catalytic subunit n=1 Tax=Aliiroseovarius sp. F20344 TaxID=2926414 RepID=UPI001FF3F2FA|nr:aspartate carbamoyltransferase catalytic subunit [Aliiroseovarius sp. F20344]MCK0140829.1 aspartate carbamoyltransferase catalytic subunit [Aliiroseovarius sp. F20344]